MALIVILPSVPPFVIWSHLSSELLSLRKSTGRIMCHETIVSSRCSGSRWQRRCMWPLYRTRFSVLLHIENTTQEGKVEVGSALANLLWSEISSSPWYHSLATSPAGIVSGKRGLLEETNGIMLLTEAFKFAKSNVHMSHHKESLVTHSTI